MARLARDAEAADWGGVFVVRRCSLRRLHDAFRRALRDSEGKRRLVPQEVRYARIMGIRRMRRRF